MRFSIRDLLWATVVVALCVSWWLDRSAMRAKHEEDEERLAGIRTEIDTIHAETRTAINAGQWAEAQKRRAALMQLRPPAPSIEESSEAQRRNDEVNRVRPRIRKIFE
jgi:hypothetical protein